MESKWKNKLVKDKLKDMDFQMDEDDHNSDESNWQPSKPIKKQKVKTAEDWDRQYEDEINNKDPETGVKLRSRRCREIGDITPIQQANREEKLAENIVSSKQKLGSALQREDEENQKIIRKEEREQKAKEKSDTIKEKKRAKKK